MVNKCIGAGVGDQSFAKCNCLYGKASGVLAFSNTLVASIDTRLNYRLFFVLSYFPEQ